MSRFVLSKRSLDRLQGVHPDLVAVVKRAIQLTKVDFTVGEGLRTVERQKELLANGKSQLLDSRHLSGHAVDLWAYCDGNVVWSFPLYKIIADAMKMAAKDLNIPIIWGGDWKDFKDGCHFELPKDRYPNVEI